VARQKRNKKARMGVLAGAAAAVLLALPGTASAAVTSEVVNGDLLVTSDAGDAITITSTGGEVKVNGNNPGTGAADSADIDSIRVDGGPNGNAIDLTDVDAAEFPAVTSILLNGGGGEDTINGSQLSDRIVGGDANDQSLGNGGNDTLVWNPGDDDDLNEGGAGNDTIEVNGGGGGEQFEIAPAAGGRAQFDRTGPTPPGPFRLDIGTAEKLDLNANGGADTFNAAGGALGLALDVDGGPGNDVLDGGDGADLIAGGADNDRIVGDNNPAGTRDDSRGDAGDDTLVWNPGDGDDRNEGGAGNDTIEVNGGGGGEVFEVKPSATPGRVAFDRTGPTPPGPFNLDIGTSERLDLNASGGDDSLNAAGPVAGLAGWTIDADGGEGNDTLAGGSDAVDLLAGGPGADTLRSRDQTADSLSGGTEVDSAVVDAQDTVAADVENVDRGQGQQPQNPPVVGPPAQDTVAPAVKVSRKAVSVGRKRIAAVRLTGPAGEDARVTVNLRRKGKLLGRKSIALDAGESKLAKVKLSRRTFALLKKRGRLQVKAVVTALDDAGNRRQRTVSLTLKAAKPKR
jgi:Ca2+-binding RTX toxin-like protein